MEKIISNNEIKLITGLSSPDAKIEIFNTTMTSLLASMLRIKQFGRWEVQNEEVNLSSSRGEYFRLRSFPVVADSITLYVDSFQKNEVTEFTYTADDYDFRRWNITDSEGNQAYLPYYCVYASYTAGFLLNGTIEITDNDLAGINLSVSSLGVTTVYSFIDSGTPGATEILLGADSDATMTAIATKLGGTGGAGFVTIPLGMTATTSEVGPTPKIVIENPDEMLGELKLALSYMVAGAISDKLQAEGVVSYRLGTKSVNFRDMSERNFADDIFKKYLSRFKTALILSK